jgi:YHS domain-containing protein
MGGRINREYYADHEGRRVYFCCPGCRPEFEKAPERYLEKLREQGVEPERTPEGVR